MDEDVMNRQLEMFTFSNAIALSGWSVVLYSLWTDGWGGERENQIILLFYVILYVFSSYSTVMKF